MLATRSLNATLDRMLTLNRALDQAFTAPWNDGRVWVPAIDAATAGEIRVHAAERGTGTFERSIRLPEFVDGEGISAAFNNGLLTVTVPKARAAQPRRIEINN